MAIKKRIADLSATLSADTRDYEAGMRRAAKATESAQGSIGKSMGGIEKLGLKLGLGVVAGGGAMSMLTNEIRNVIDNIEKIPGVPASTIASIQQTRLAFSEARNTVDQAIAGVVSFTSWAARAAGFAGGALVYGLDAAEQGYWDFASAAEKAANEQKRVADEAKRVAEEEAAATRIRANATAIQDKGITEATAAYDHYQKAKEAYDRREETQIEKMIRLRKEANDVLNNIMPGQSSPKNTENQARAFEQLTEAAKLEKDLQAVAKQHLDYWTEFLGLDANPLYEAWEPEVEKMTKAATDMGYAFESAFENAIIGGKSLSNVLGGLMQDMAKIALRNLVTAPLGNWFGGLFSGVFGGPKASGGPVSGGTSYLVGEQGPEIFTPQGAGSITPNHAIGGKSGGTYYIDARGADRTGLAQLADTIRKLNGSIEARALGAVMNARQRGAMA